MRFELSDELLDQIIFAMENQEVRHVLDSRDAKVINELEIVRDPTGADLDENESAGEERYLPLPEWVSVDGYMLMESFVAGLRNPLYRENLRKILQSGRGVFRQFKDALKERKDIERLWFRHKQREMRRRVIEWYNDLREIWGLAPLSVNDEAETEDLLLADFTFEIFGAKAGNVQQRADSFGAEAEDTATEHHLAVYSPWTPELLQDLRGWDERVTAELSEDKNEEERVIISAIRSRKLPREEENEKTVACLVRTPANERAGFLWAIEGSGLVAFVIQLTVTAEYRGLGMGNALLRMYERSARERGIKRIVFEIPEHASFLKNALIREGYYGFSESLQIEL